jgi:hypothetical protein
MSAWPTSPAFRFPVTRTIEFQTGIASGRDGTEQRWMRTTGIESWSLNYSRLSLAERDALISAYEAAKGSFDSTLSFTFAGTTYTGCYLDSDSLSFSQANPKQWSTTVKLKQAYRSPDAGSLGSDFPTLTGGATAQFPFTHSRTFDTDAVVTEGGRYSSYNRATPQKSWAIGGPSLTDADALAIWNYFLLARGKYAQFAYTDVDSATRYTNCRFAVDSLEWRYIAPRVNSIQASVVAL